MKRIITGFVILTIISITVSKADEGMWIPLLLDKYNIKIMQENGFKLTAEDIYSINQACMKDAVVHFGGCTAELISGEGLIITNHHCGEGRIRSHSTVENDYLTNGFWAMTRDGELPNPGTRVTILIRMEEVTDEIIGLLTDEMDEQARQNTIREKISELIAEATEGTHYTASIRPFYQGNQYFMFVNEVFLDVRLVGAPPSAIGSFGGDTDNWMWPRHTGDFSLFRIYAGKDNMPAPYAADNVPYKPKKFFPISLKGVKEGDFTMVFGYPGSTFEYKPSFHLEMMTEHINPEFIKVRGEKITIIEAAMNTSPKIRIQYTSKASGISNSWKRWIGENKGLEILDAISKKKEFEMSFQEWAESDPGRNSQFGNILEKYQQLYEQMTKFSFLNSYFNETFFRRGIETVSFAGQFVSLAYLANSDASEEEIKNTADQLKSRTERFFNDYDQPTDHKLFIALMQLFSENVSPEFKPEAVKQAEQKYSGDFSNYADVFYKETMFGDRETVLNFLDGITAKKAKSILKDPAYQLFIQANEIHSIHILPEYRLLNNDITKLDRIYMKAQMEYQPERLFYPDANSTLRVSYGKVSGYFPRDAEYFLHSTTLEGIMEKDNPEIYDYDVPDKLKELYHARDYGRYGEDGKMNVCFIATNHTTGGNSGSPVINSEGHLIGVNFDRAWEGVMSDLMFNPKKCRNISLDIRFALFIIDKFAGAGYLLNEMELVY